jgi:hypothetical protein
LKTMAELAHMARTRPEKLKKRKADGVKVVGYIGRFVPKGDLIVIMGHSLVARYDVMLSG